MYEAGEQRIEGRMTDIIAYNNKSKLNFHY